MIASLRIALIVALPTVAAGCFDVPTNQRTPLLIDDFDSGNALPSDRYFDQWRCGQVDPDMKGNCSCNYDATTYHSPPYSIYLDATVTETGDKKSVGAQLYTQADVPEDLSHMSEIVFSARYDAGSPAIPSEAILWVELHCSFANTYIHRAAQNWQSSGWQTFAIGLSYFDFPWVPPNGGRAACLEQVDSIHFSVNAGLPSGQKGSFVLHLDDVYFR